jgi:hypothetical protein
MGNGTFALTSFMTFTASTIGIASGGYGSNGYATVGIAPSFTAGVPLMFAFDVDAGKGWVSVGGVWANAGNPAAGTNPSFTFTANNTIFAGCSINVTGCTATLNTGASAFTNTVPSGFNAGWYI